MNLGMPKGLTDTSVFNRDSNFPCSQRQWTFAQLSTEKEEQQESIPIKNQVFFFNNNTVYSFSEAIFFGACICDVTSVCETLFSLNEQARGFYSSGYHVLCDQGATRRTTKPWESDGSRARFSSTQWGSNEFKPHGDLCWSCRLLHVVESRSNVH